MGKYISASLGNPWDSLYIVCNGDSNTWATGASGGSVDPATATGGTLAIARQDYNAKSWPNLLHKTLGEIVCHQLGFSNPSPGDWRYKKPYDLDICKDSNVKLKDAGGTEISRAFGTSASPLLGRYLDINVGHAIEFDFIGNEFDVVYASQAVAGGDGEFKVYIDGVLIVVQSSWEASSQWTRRKNVLTGDGKHSVRIVNTSSTAKVRLEAITHHRVCSLVNNGIIGTWTAQWAPGAQVTLADAVKPYCTHSFWLLGTNNRVRSLNNGANRAYEDLNDVFGWLATNRPDCSNYLLTPPYAQGSSEFYSNPTVYRFPVPDVVAAVRRVAVERSIPLVDVFAVTSRMAMNGGSIFSDAGLHLNDAGQVAIHDELFSKIKFGQI